ncbi:hypothetical protein FHU33_3914 [Blastococcus colisei]|uniref:PhiRv1 phage protein n=1 Tax=Blastococcus colisei TaxID=1564162 RepID=A0A543PK06_9ACTN|nr:hypothetical protein FHU33_3914 [Blastococcus colisei]
MSAVHTARARVAGLSRHRGPDSPDTLQARRDLRAVRLEEYISRTLATAPPLTDEQRERLASLFTPATSGGAAA